MKNLAIAAALVLSTLTAAAADDAGPLAVAHQFVDGINHNDMKSAAATYAPMASIIDEFPPHHWQGATAFADWVRDFGTNSAKHGDTDAMVTLAKPLQSQVTGDRAYLVIPATFSFKEHGKTLRESGSIMTFALQKLDAGWRICGWAWSARQTAH